MSLVDLEDAQARAGEITQDQVDEVEEWLASLIGPLVGSRTETFYLSEARNPRWMIDGLFLSRKTDAVILTTNSIGEDAVSLTAGTDYRLINNLLIERIKTGEAWLDVASATYTPNDEEAVRSVIYDLLTYRQTPAGTQSIRIGMYSETYFPEGNSTTSADPVLGALLRRILPAAGMGLTSPFRYSGTRRDRTLITGTGS
jgi:hypothetical protein